jgi:lysophospholipase L1-like esterase
MFSHTRKTILRWAVVVFVLLLPFAASAQTTWTDTALGDSLAVGAIAFRGYVPRYRDYIRTDTGVAVSLSNLGQNGWWSSDLRSALTDPSNPNYSNFRQQIAKSQVVTWDIGGNDLRSQRSRYKKGLNTTSPCGGADNQDCFRLGVQAFKENWDAIIAAIVSLRSTDTTIIRTMDIYNPYVNQDKASDSWPDDGGLNDFQVLKPYLDDVNNYIATSAALNNIPYAKVYLKFNGINGDIDPRTFGYISFDGLHPNDGGHKAIADSLRVLGYSPLR